MKEIKRSSQVDHLMQSVLNMPGRKILTLAVGTESRIYAFDISEKGVIGYHKSHKRMFYSKLRKAMNNHGGLIIRQFLPLKVERTTPNGKKIWVPIKNVYGVYLGNGSWSPLSAAEVREVSCVDAATGKPVPPERTVRYLAFPILNRKIKG